MPRKFLIGLLIACCGPVTAGYAFPPGFQAPADCQRFGFLQTVPAVIKTAATKQPEEALFYGYIQYNKDLPNMIFGIQMLGLGQYLTSPLPAVALAKPVSDELVASVGLAMERFHQQWQVEVRLENPALGPTVRQISLAALRGHLGGYTFNIIDNAIALVEMLDPSFAIDLKEFTIEQGYSEKAKALDAIFLDPQRQDLARALFTFGTFLASAPAHPQIKPTIEEYLKYIREPKDRTRGGIKAKFYEFEGAVYDHLIPLITAAMPGVKALDVSKFFDLFNRQHARF